jgi:hypothetical protein
MLMAESQLFKQLSTRVSRSGISNNSDYSSLQSEDMDTMCRVAPEDYSIGHQGMKLGIMY